jgi:hypothetical protein
MLRRGRGHAVQEAGRLIKKQASERSEISTVVIFVAGLVGVWKIGDREISSGQVVDSLLFCR